MHLVLVRDGDGYRALPLGDGDHFPKLPAREEWEAARKAVSKQTDPSERVKARAHAERLEREYRKKLASLRNPVCRQGPEPRAARAPSDGDREAIPHRVRVLLAGVGSGVENP